MKIVPLAPHHLNQRSPEVIRDDTRETSWSSNKKRVNECRGGRTRNGRTLKSEKNSGATVNPPDGPKDSDLVGGRGDGTKKDRNWGLTPLEIKCLGPFRGSSWAWELGDLGVDSFWKDVLRLLRDFIKLQATGKSTVKVSA
ncbi:hypothetical protein RUM44_013671 [Polyplax serrata]|uniref:Uncharacterized protein n=1 Tax=Polyplax serrata TaxID=468196 RepID=A0ABR1BEU9_POLSC